MLYLSVHSFCLLFGAPPFGIIVSPADKASKHTPLRDINYYAVCLGDNCMKQFNHFCMDTYACFNVCQYLSKLCHAKSLIANFAEKIPKYL